jgi:uncharacterized membrane protein (UPF0127 family)
MALKNSRSGAVIASSVELAMTSAERRRGLLGRDSMAPDSAIVITRCNAVHTFWMRFAIDVAFVDSSGTVKKIVEGLIPWRIAGTLFASTVIEFPAGTLKGGVLQVGDRVFLTAEPGRRPLWAA